MVVKRIQQHYKIRSAMSKGDFASAVTLIKETLAAEGSHISLWIDLASSYYMLGDYLQAQKITEKAATEFSQCCHLLGTESILRASIGLGRLFEESGECLKAMALYEIENYVREQAPFSLVAKLDAQKLRLKAFIGYQKNITQDFLTCERASLTQPTNIDLFHSLILAHHFLGQPDLAQKILQGSFEKEMPLADRRLLLFDHLAELLCMQSLPFVLLEECKTLLHQIDYFQCDAFEKAIANFINGEVSISSVSEMSLIGAFKYLYIIERHGATLELQHQARIMNRQRLQSFDSKTQHLLKKRWPLPISSPAPQMTRDQGKIFISHLQNQLFFTPDSFGAQILELFLKRNVDSLNIEEALASLYNDDLNEHSRERIRKAISRFNREFESKLGLNQTLSYQKNQIKLLRKFKIV